MWRKPFWIFIVACSCFSSLSAASRKTYSIENVSIRIALAQDGSATIREARTYKFDGGFTYATYSLDTGKLRGVEVLGVSEIGKSYIRSESKTPGTFWVKQTASQTTLTWYYQATDTYRTFVIELRIPDVVRVYDDVAEFYYKLIGTGWDRATMNMDAAVECEGLTAASEIRAWAHNDPMLGTVKIDNNGSVWYSVKRLPARTFFEGRIVYPAHYFPASDNRLPGVALPRILNEEEEWAAEANKKRKAALDKFAQRQKMQEQGMPVLVGLHILFALVLIWAFFKYGRQQPVPASQIMASELPGDDVDPATANYVYNLRTITGQALVATIFDLARRELLRIEEREVTRQGFFHRQRTKTEYFIVLQRDANLHSLDLPTPSAEMYLLLETLAGNATELSFDDLGSARITVRRFFGKWRKTVAAHAGRPFYNPDSVRAVVRLAIFAFLLLCVDVAAVVLMGEPAAVFIPISIALGALSLAVLRLAPDKYVLREKLKALRRYLQKYHTALVDHISYNMLDRYLIYALTLGVSSKVLRSIARLIPTAYGNNAFPWFLYAHDGHSPDFATAMTSLISAANSTMTSASGAGGGASAGGGGGAGGSGGGAG